MSDASVSVTITKPITSVPEPPEDGDAGVASGIFNFRSPWEMNTASDGTIGINEWTERIGHGFAAMQYGQYWMESDGDPTPFYTSNADTIWNYGAVPVVNWNAWQQGQGAVQEPFSAEHIIAGDWDALIDAYADGIRTWATGGRWVVIRFNHEMNMTSGQFPWQPDRPGNAPDQFVQAWRHVVERFYARDCGPERARWFWCPGQRSTTHELPLGDFWPGADVVQIVGADCYNWNTPYLSLAQAFRGPTAGGPDYIYDTYGEIMALPGAGSLPFWLGETGTVYENVDVPAWWQQAVDELQEYMPACRCALWYDDTGHPTRISGDATREAAFVTANQHARMHGERGRL
jgi:Glycosyl hydrolase family 26